MTADEVRTVLLVELGTIAPEADLGALDAKADLREALDIDSMDFLNWVTAIHARLDIDIPERDYPKLSALAGAVEYVAAAAAAKKA